MGTPQRKVMSTQQKDSVTRKGLQAFPPLVAVPDEVKERAFELWSTVAARNANAVRGLMELEADPGERVPTSQSIRTWAKQWDWAARADYELGDTSALSMKELERKYRAIMLGGADVLLRAQTGGYKGREMEGALAVKATEIGMKVLKERYFVATEKAKPQQVEGKVLTREEQESQAQRAMIQRERKSR